MRWLQRGLSILIHYAQVPWFCGSFLSIISTLNINFTQCCLSECVFPVSSVPGLFSWNWLIWKCPNVSCSILSLITTLWFVWPNHDHSNYCWWVPVGLQLSHELNVWCLCWRSLLPPPPPVQAIYQPSLCHHFIYHSAAAHWTPFKQTMLLCHRSCTCIVCVCVCVPVLCRAHTFAVFGSSLRSSSRAAPCWYFRKLSGG